MRLHPPPRRTGFAAGSALLAVLVSGCDFVARYRAGPPEHQLAQAILAQWAPEGGLFMEGAAGRDTVAAVTATGERSWEVAVMPRSGGSPTVWALEVVRVESYPTFPGPAFSRFLSEQARELGMRTFLPPEVMDQISSGAILGVGEIEVRYGRAELSGRNTETRVAYLTPEGEGADPSWRIQGVSRSANVLLQALRTVTDDLLRRDDRVLSCMGSLSPAGVSRAVQLACIRKVWTAEFEAPG